ncbi:MAG TPA: 3-dehydroquinate synthase, partial [Thermodesulfobacteriota bacterium]
MAPFPFPHAIDGEQVAEVHLQQINVSYDYPVYFTTDVFAPGNRALRDAVTRREPTRRHRLFVVLERRVAEVWPGLADRVLAYAAEHRDRLVLADAPEVLEGGEAAKHDPASVARLHARLEALAMDRQSVVVCVGGGALLDVVGYATATCHRGLRLVRVPTTVLAQCDSGVGVKNGVNAFGKKNFLGTFAPPFAVLNDRRFLETLPHRDVVAGMGEAVKVALIRDAAFFEWIEAHAARLAAGDGIAIAELIASSARLHLRHIATSGDPFEFGSARPLDFGHWAAHKLESLTANRAAGGNGYAGGDALRHGEAVAIGVAIDTVYSADVGLLPEAACDRVLDLLERLGFRLWDDALARTDAAGRLLVLDGLAEFREHLGGDLTVTLLAGIGRGVEVHELDPARVAAAIDRLARRDAAR